MDTASEPTKHTANSTADFRRGTVADSYTVFAIFEESLADLNRRAGKTKAGSADDPAALARMWEERRTLYEHLAATAEQFWLAEKDGQALGFSRSVVRDGLQLLTELFVLPGDQSAGLGRELLGRALPDGVAQRRAIISSPDLRAQALYLRAGVYPRFPVYYWGGRPEAVDLETDLVFEPVSVSPENVAIMADIDRQLLGHRRDQDHRWLLADRQRYVYRRGGRPVGYGYLGRRNGPFALLESDDFWPVLAHAETTAAGQYEHFGLELPMINQVAVDYVLSRGYRMDILLTQFMSNEPFGRFENYIFTSPPFIL